MENIQNLEKVFEHIMESEDSVEEFLQLGTLDEMYEFFLKIDGSISRSEFDTFIVQLLGKYNIGHLTSLSDDDLTSVSGGVSGAGTKIASAVLSAFAMKYGFDRSAHISKINNFDKNTML